MRKVVVIGGGPGGYVAALKAAILGADVTLVEKDEVGGTCLNRGCIPTKAFLSCGDFMDSLKTADYYGVTVPEGAKADFPAMAAHKDAIVGQLVSGVRFLLKNRGVKVVKGTGSLTKERQVCVTREDGTTEVLEVDRIILAAGSSAAVPSMFRYDGRQVITSDEALNLKTLPSSMVIVGGGVIGCEFGQFYQKMGVKVTIVEMAAHILPNEDQEIVSVLQKSLKKEKIKIYCNAKIESLKKEEDAVVLTLEGGEQLSAEKVLLSVGRRAYTDGLGLEAAGVRAEHGTVLVDQRMETSVKGIYAIGDIVDSPLLAHVASKEGCVAAENCMERDSVISYHAVPRCVYTEPEVACVGMTEEDAKQKGLNYKVGRFNFAGIGKAVVMGKTKGFVKIITDESDKIIGAGIIGPHSTDLIGELTLAVHLGLTSQQAGDVIHAHPTLSEAVMEALHDVSKESVHSY